MWCDNSLVFYQIEFLGVKLGESEATVENSSGVSIRQLITILLNIINEDNFYDYAVISSCQDCLRLLGERLKGML